MKKQKMPTDPMQRAKLVIDLATGEVEPEAEREKDPASVALGRQGGLIGGKRRAEKLSPERRREIAKKAAAARWGTPRRD
ncbi:MAG: histone H1 [Candidatus Limnocylindria bacterium]